MRTTWILIPPFPGSNPGAPASTQSAELFTETALFSANLLGAFGKSIPPLRHPTLQLVRPDRHRRAVPDRVRAPVAPRPPPRPDLPARSCERMTGPAAR